MTNKLKPQVLATVTSADFLIGTQVMIDSFLCHNRWFDGRIVIIHDDLSPADQAVLRHRFPQSECRNPAPDLWHCIADLIEHRPKLSSRYRRFFSLDIFDDDGNGGVLFADSDMLFSKSIEPIANVSAPIAACADRAMLVGNSRDRKTLEELTQPAGTDGFQSFNAGLMFIKPELRTRETRQCLLGSLAPKAWDNVVSDHTDQAVLNRCFGDLVELISPAYNRMVGHGGRLSGIEYPSVASARALHFNGKAKPWRMTDDVRKMTQHPDYAAALKLWHAAYRRLLDRAPST
uniref:glycosyltransferase n=1 Tax=Parerythrobacter lutipelagi TaxID=1964208 RepID=UPI0010F753BA|nr:glycosyltransferase [Parerythrobacter lutipelagi]